MKTATKIVYLMGTEIELWVVHPRGDALVTEAEKRLRAYEQRFSANRGDSELMAINLQAGVRPVQVAADLFSLIRLGREHSLAPNSFLNIAIGPLVQAWRIGFADAHEPDPLQIEQVLQLIDPHKIWLNEAESTVYLAEPGMSLDLGALAKGYFADEIMAFFRREGAVAGFINLGGNVLTFGEAPHRQDGAWRIGIQNPFLPRGNYVAVLPVKNQSVVTSGIYERTFTWQGNTYHHIFDSTTGYPLQADLASLTIVSPVSVDGEIWTTRLFGRDATAVIQEVEQRENLESLVITTTGQLARTKGLQVE